MDQMKSPIINIPDELKKRKYGNSLRTGFTKDEIHMDFGYMTGDEDECTIDMVSRIAVSPSMLQTILVTLFETGIQFQKEFNVGLGFPSGDDFDEETDEVKECE